MKRLINVLLLLAVIGIFGIIYAAPDWIVDPPIHRSAMLQPSDKYDGDCTGHEIAGRCARKCPNPTDIAIDYQLDTYEPICVPQSISTAPPAVYNAIEPPVSAQPEHFVGK